MKYIEPINNFCLSSSEYLLNEDIEKISKIKDKINIKIAYFDQEIINYDHIYEHNLKVMYNNVHEIMEKIDNFIKLKIYTISDEL